MDAKIQLGPGYTKSSAFNSARTVCFVDVEGNLQLGRGAERSEIIYVRDKVQPMVNCPIAWAANGQRLYYAQDQLYSVTINGLTQPLTSFLPAQQNRIVWFLACSDQSVFYLRQGDSDAGIWRLSLGDSEITQIYEQSAETKVWAVCTNPSVDVLAIALRSLKEWQICRSNLEGQVQIAVPVEGVPYHPYPTMTLSPDANSLVYANERGLHLIDFEHGSRTMLNSFGWFPSFSPNGKDVAFMKDDYAVYLLDVKGGTKPEKICEVQGRHYSRKLRGFSWAEQPSWSPDGRFLWFRLTKCLPKRNHQDKRDWRVASWWSGIADTKVKTISFSGDYQSRVAWCPTLMEPASSPA